MDERELRTYYRAAQPILQRTAPVPSQSRVKITPPVLDQIAWNVVLAFVANASQQPPEAIPCQARSGESALRDEEVRAALDSLKQASVRPKLQTKGAALTRFSTAVRRLLDAYGWAPQRAAQAADEVAAALRSVTQR